MGEAWPGNGRLETIVPTSLQLPVSTMDWVVAPNGRNRVDRAQELRRDEGRRTLCLHRWLVLRAQVSSGSVDGVF